MSYFNYTDYDDPVYVVEYGLKPLYFKRTVFCHPEDKHWIKDNILSDDITLLTSEWLSRNSYIASKDVVVNIRLQLGQDNGDFENNTIAVVASHTFS